MIEDYQISHLQPLKDPVVGAILTKDLPPDFKFEVADLETPYKPVIFYLTYNRSNYNQHRKTRRYSGKYFTTDRKSIIKS
jgi:hypothetical protein